MKISATSIRFDDASLWVEPTDGRTLGVSLAWFPRLLHATPAQRAAGKINRVELHWKRSTKIFRLQDCWLRAGDVSKPPARVA